MRKSDQFDEAYFKTGFGPNAYERSEDWLAFYANIVDQIVRSLKPRTVMDAGCALGMIVESLWDRGVEAKGVDISEFAISKVRPDMREHCKVASLTEPFQNRYDLIVCIEVLEHMPADDARLAIANFAEATDVILFSSTPYDFEEVTHVNVRPILSWLKEFMEFGFVPDILYDASYITPHAILFKKGAPLSEDVQSLISEHLRLKHILNENIQNFKSRSDALQSELLQARSEAIELQKYLSQAEQQQQHELNLKQNEVQRLQREIEQIQITLRHARELHQSEAITLHERMVALQNQIGQMEGSTSWRITTPLRQVGRRLPPSFNNRLRQIAKFGYWALTPHRMPTRIEFMRKRNEALALSVSQPLIPTQLTNVASSGALIEAQFSRLAPLPIYKDRSSEKTVTVLTDSVDRNSLFGGVATALIAGIFVANKLGARFRLATRTNPPDPAVLGTIMKAHNIQLDGAADFSHIPWEGSNPLPVGDDDIMLTTSWWGTYSALGSMNAEKIIYILQEDERMFYPHDDSRLKCSETLSNPNISLLINTDLLYNHLKEGMEPLASFSERAVSFQPAFPAFPKPDQIVRSDKKRNFFFYARPNHARNLYWRGLEVIDSAMRNGLFADNEWNINFVGQGIEPLSLPGDVSPKIWSNLSWSDYANFVSKMDLGLSLMDTPHPSYPPLDLAASGAIVVTNQHGIKNSLEVWSKNIITAPADTLSLVDALRVGAERSKNLSERHANCMNDNIERNWEASLGMAIDRLLNLRNS
ncbi:rhamnosyltransferase WsaF family glycosyltransferase [Brucella lupini]